MKKALIIIPFLLCTLFSWAQKKNDVIQSRVEFIAQDLEVENISLEDVFDVLYYYYDHPLNLNKATKDDLQELFLINDFQINALLKKRNIDGSFKTIFEIKDVEYWDLVTLENILPFVVVSPVKGEKKSRKSIKKFFKEGELEAFFRYQQKIENKAGYANVSDEEREESSKYYWGSPAKLYSRIRFKHKKDFSLGVTMEKDPGEQFFGEKQPYGFDFYSAHAYYSGNKLIRKAVVGDYQMQIGQGLAMWTGYGFSKSVAAASVRKNARGLKAYSSTDETRFMRGAGVELGINHFSLTTWASYKGVDGSIQTVDTLENEQERLASSINLSGYHRTTSQLERKNSLMELIYGGHLKYENRGLKIGVSAIQQGYDSYYQREDRLVNKYEFRGKELLSLSADYSYIYRSLSVFGEVAQSRSSNAVAFLQGVSVAIGRKASLSALYRNYPKDYHTFYATAFAESSRPINESGIYLGGTFQLNNDWALNAYADFFKSKWLRYRVDGPSEGNELMGQLKYRPSTSFKTYIRYREQNKMINSSDYEGNIRPIETYHQRKYQVGLDIELFGGWKWRSRVDYVTDKRESSGFQDGFSISQDLLYRRKDFPLQLTLRYAIFNTDSYDTRVYSYEYNLQNVFSIPVYFGQGSRAYALVRYTFWNGRCDLWVRYAAFVYHGEETISSGSEEIQGSVKSEFGAQLRIRL